MADEAIKRINTEETSQQSEDVEPQGDWFTQRRLPDDVTLKFDDGKELFASKGLLMCASPVFEAIFTHDMMEMETNVVEMPSRNYDHFLELLKCFHPGIAKPVTHENVFFLVGLAHEYQIKLLLQRCHDAFRKIMLHTGKLGEEAFQSRIPEQVEEWLKENNKDGDYQRNNESIILYTNKILKVLSFVAKFQDALLITEAIDILSHIKVKYYVAIRQQKIRQEGLEKLLKQNIAMFEQFDVTIRARISRARLLRIDAN